MKKVVSILMLAIAMMALSIPMEAKTTSKKSSKSSHSSLPPITATFRDGFPNIIGHSYTKTEGGVKMVLTFLNEDEASLNLSRGSKSETVIVEWEYIGDGYLLVDSYDGSQAIELYIDDKGRKLYMVTDEGIMRSYGAIRMIK